LTKDAKIRERFIDLRADGWTLTKIAQELGISYKTAINWNKEDKELIDVAQAIHAEELHERYFMAKQKRIELFGERLLAIKDELEKRDLSEIPTPQLFSMMVKCQTILKKEETALEFMTDEQMKARKGKRENEELMDIIHSL